MTKTCAYCEGPPPFSREHIWPNGFLKRGGFELKYSARANKTFEGDLIIADVCAACNNGPLSVLDAHACELFDRRFSKRVESGVVVPFTYDYGLLLRWLLKVSFNSARTTGQDVEVLSRYRDTVVSRDPCSPVWAVAFVASISPTIIGNPATGDWQKLYPDAARCGPMRIPGVEISDLAVLRCVMIRAFCFTLLITRSVGIDGHRIAPVIGRIPGQPLDYSGRMRVGPPSIPANVALDGISNWPRPRGRR